MDVWQLEAQKKMIDFLIGFSEIERIEAKGSTLDPCLLDALSDVDLEIYLSNDPLFNIKEAVEIMPRYFGDVFGYEIQSDNNCDLLRICFENGWRFDLSFINPEAIESQISENTFSDNIESIMNRFWFMASMVAVKLGRKDHLIAAHLALELCQMNIAIQMLVRDNAKGSDIHRFGGGEDVPILHSWTKLNGSNKLRENTSKDNILHILLQAAKQMDTTFASLDTLYKSRTKILVNLLDMFQI